MWPCISDSEACGENFKPQGHRAPLRDVDLQSEGNLSFRKTINVKNTENIHVGHPLKLATSNRAAIWWS